MALRHVDLDDRGTPRADALLHLDVLGGHRAGETEGAALDRPDVGPGLKGHLDIPREIAVVGDVAGRAESTLKLS